MTMRPSPIVALNRAIAIAQAEGPEWGLEEIRLITDCNRLAAYPFHSGASHDHPIIAGLAGISRLM
jgi:RNA polymerase sigma-70 factor (ECF subfamily)